MSEHLNQDAKAPTGSPYQEDGSPDHCALFGSHAEHREGKFMLHSDCAGLSALDDLISHGQEPLPKA